LRIMRQTLQIPVFLKECAILTDGGRMNILKLQDAIAELDAESDRCKRLADGLRAEVRRHGNGDARPLIQSRGHQGQKRLDLHNREQKSVRTLALEILGASIKPLHVADLVKIVNEQRRDPTNRASLESQLVRAVKSHRFGVKRTAPSTFTVAT